MNTLALTNLNNMYQRGVFSINEYAQALRNLHNSSTDDQFRTAVRLRLASVVRKERAN